MCVCVCVCVRALNWVILPKELTTPTFFPIEDSLILLVCGCHGNRLHYKAEEGVVRSVWEKRPELASILQRGKRREEEERGEERGSRGRGL